MATATKRSKDVPSPRDQWRQCGLRLSPEVRRSLRAAANLKGTTSEIYLDTVLRDHLAGLGLLALARS